MTHLGDALEGRGGASHTHISSGIVSLRSGLTEQILVLQTVDNVLHPKYRMKEAHVD